MFLSGRFRGASPRRAERTFAPAGGKQRLVLLDLQRIAASAYIVAFHAIGGLWAIGQHGSETATRLLSKGYLGTTFFMLLSGMLLTLLYGRRVTSAEQRKSFWINRFSRCYPAYLLCLLVSVLPFYVFGETRPFDQAAIGELLRSALLLEPFIPGHGGGIVGQSWTLSTLFVFYLIFPFILEKLSNVTPARIKTLIFASGAVYIGIAALYNFILPDGVVTAFNDQQPSFNFMHVFPLLRLYEPVLGLLIGLYLLRSAPGRSLNFYRGCQVACWGVIGLGLLAPAETPLFPLMHNGLFLPFFTLILIAQQRSQAQKPLRLPARLTAGIERLADGTLSVYLWHGLSLGVFLRLSSHLGLPVDLAVCLAVFGSFSVILPLHRHVFNPLSVTVRRALSGRAARVPETQAVATD